MARIVPMGISLFLLLALGGPDGAAAAQRPLALDDLHRIVELSTPAASPDGRWIAYVATRADVQANRKVASLWLRSWDGKRAREIRMPAPHGAWQPSFLADGRSIAFLSDAGTDGLAQVWVAPIAGGAPRAVTRLPQGVDDYFLAPGGQRLVAVSSEAPPGGGDRNAPIVIDRFLFKDDDHGYLWGPRRHLFVVTMADLRARQLTHGDFDAFLPTWSPDGGRIAYVSRHVEAPGRTLGFDLYSIDAQTGGDEIRVSDPGHINNDPDHLSRPAWSPDGRSIAYLQGGEERWLEYAPWELVVADASGGARVRRVGAADFGYTHPAFSADGRFLFALVEESRVTHLERIELATGERVHLTQGARFGFDLAVGPQGAVALLSGDDTHPYRMSAIAPDGIETMLPGHNDWLGGIALQTHEDIEVRSPDGTLVQGFLVRPRGYESGRRYPAVLALHGGPQYQFSHEFAFDWQLYSAQGYVVVGVNPRGSSGRGFEYSRGIYADWGRVDVPDVLAGIDAAIDAGIADPDRLGVGGWSYGGYLTDLTIATTRRFRAAVSGAGSGNAIAMYGSDEYTAWLEYELGTPWKDFERYARVSYPFLHADRISTPTLFLCGQLDFNVPCVGAEQMYQALRSNGVASRLVVYPGMHHEPDTPAFERDRLQRFLQWFDRYLKP